MAAKHEEANVVPVGNTGFGASSSSQPIDVPPAYTNEKANDFGSEDKKVEAAAEDLGELSLTNKDQATLSNKENGIATTTATSSKTDTIQPTTGPVWPETPEDHPLTRLYSQLEATVKEAGHSEVYGITLSTSTPFHTKLILQKFLRANQNDVSRAKQQLLDTLKWRKEFDPVKAMNETYSKERFGGLGYVLELEGVPGSENKRDIATFNIYGAVKDKKATFGDLDNFLRWRVGLQEKSIQSLSLSTATTPIPDFGLGPDPYQGYQIHDYLQVSFLRQEPAVKAATAKTIEILGRHYPETLSRKFFLNVPVIMGWVYNAVKMVVAKETAKKFTVLSYGNMLVGELGAGVPEVYGGKKGGLEDVAEGMNLA